VDGPEFVTGNMVRGEDLWDRETELADILASLGKGSVLLKAPRRYGKTSLMNKIYEDPPQGWNVFFLDAEGARRPEEFIAAVGELALRKLPSAQAKRFLTSSLGAVLDRIGELSVADFRIDLKQAVAQDWREQGNSLVSVLAGFESPVVFIIDEFPTLIANIERHVGPDDACDFLRWFRAARQNPALAAVRWLAAGSIAVETVIQRVGAGTEVINDFAAVTVGPFSDDVAKSLIRALVETDGRLKPPSDELTQFIVDAVGSGVPFFIQVLLKESVSLAVRERSDTLSEAIVKRAYFESVLGPANRTYFDHFYERLARDFDETRTRVAKRLILEVARRGSVPSADLRRLFAQIGEGRLDNEDFNEILAYVENEYYVRLDPGQGAYQFSTNILRDWWMRYHDQVEETS
jgi:uncharacterized protein